MYQERWKFLAGCQSSGHPSLLRRCPSKTDPDGLNSASWNVLSSMPANPGQAKIIGISDSTTTRTLVRTVKYFVETTSCCRRTFESNGVLCWTDISRRNQGPTYSGLKRVRRLTGQSTSRNVSQGVSSDRFLSQPKRIRSSQSLVFQREVQKITPRAHPPVPFFSSDTDTLAS